MSNVSDTSLEAYFKLLSTGQFSAAQKRVLNVLAYRQSTRQEIAGRTGLSLSSVCGRVRELIVAGAVCNAERSSDEGTGCSRWKLKIKEDSDVQKSQRS